MRVQISRNKARHVFKDHAYAGGPMTTPHRWAHDVLPVSDGHKVHMVWAGPVFILAFPTRRNEK